MRITKESDYAMRIIAELAKAGSVLDANTLSARTMVTPRFTLKILHKLVGAGIVRSFKGALGGYQLKMPPEDITLKQIIELIDGPIAIVSCLDNGEGCSMNSDKTACAFHHIFDKISFELSVKLKNITIADVINKNY